MTTLVRALSVAFLLVAAASADEIEWSKDLTAAFADAKAQDAILMICVNAKYVDGKTTEERANKGLREVVYKDARVVEKSREFVCALFTPGSTKGEFGELRALGIEGDIVSPQHIFVHPAGDKILLRKEYWSHGKGEEAVAALLELMRDAQDRLDGGGPAPDEAPAPEPEGPADAERPAWIKERLGEVEAGPRAQREAAIAALVRNDREGDCTGPLLALLEKHKKDKAILVGLVRGLGRDQLLVAAPPLADLLGHKDDVVRGNAAVSLEYIGSNDKKVVAALLKAAGREKDDAIANHVYRALGRCGVGNAKVRSLLLKKGGGAKSEFASYGPLIGLAYFEGDKKAARGVEKILKKIGIPGSRRGGGQNTVKRSVLSWTLAAIGDYGSGEFVREELIAKLENVQAFWVEPLKAFYQAVARKCEGEQDATLETVAQGVRGAVAFAKGARLGRYGAETRHLMDEYRKDRESDGFVPRGDYLLGSGGDS